MINYVETDSFKKLGDGQFQFGQGANIVCGDNGAGKSTLFKAIRFALFGASATGSAKDSLPTYGSKNCRVKLGLGDIVITRDLRNCKITRNDEVVAEGNSACTEFIQDYLGMDFKAFNLFCLSSQGETQALLTLGATEINKKVEQYSGITLIDQVISMAKQDATIHKAQLEDLEEVDCTRLETSILELEVNLTTLRQEASTLKDQVAQQEKSVDNRTKELSEAQIHNHKVSAAKQAVSDASQQLCSLSEQLNSNTKEITALQEVCLDTSTLQKELTKLKHDLENKIEHNKTYQRVIQAKQVVDDKIDRLKPLADKERASITTLKVLEPKAARKQAELDEEAEKLAEARRALKSAKQLVENGVCPECLRPHEDFDLASAKKNAKELEINLAGIEARYNNRKTDLEALNSEIQDLKANVQDYERKMDDLVVESADLFQNSLVTLNFDEDVVNALRDKIAAKKADLNQLQNNHDKLARCIELQTKLKTQRMASKESYDRNLPISQLDYLDIDSLESVLEREKKAYKSNANELHQKEIDIANLASDLSHAIESLEKTIASNEKYARTVKKLGVCNDLLKLLRDKRQIFMSEIWQRILSCASNFVNETTSGWIVEIQRDEKGNFNFREDGQQTSPILGNASGAQAAFCGTAIRVGIAQALHGRNSMLLLDEPTESMTEENAARLASGLTSLGGQTILITHRKSEAYTANNVIEL